MKKYLLLLCVLLLSGGFEVKAEDWTELQHEVSLSYGGLPVFDLLSHYENYFQPSNPAVDFYDDKGKFGGLNVSYIFYPDENWGLGLVYSYTNSDKLIFNKEQFRAIGDFYNSYHTIAPSFKYNWFNYNFITLYSRINAGITIATANASYISKTGRPEEDRVRKVFFMYQASPIGIELGNQIAGFVEVGFGHMGTAMAGVRYRM